ncbi:MAG: S8 family serine peptidase, partial [Chthoniobacterales bacterium]|nr:S8 family serine peptidase [Chthoniobacterales bacterium]
MHRTPAEILAGKDLSDPVQRAIAASEMTDAEEARYAAVLAKAEQMGIPVRLEGPSHNVSILYDIRAEGPLYRKTLNTNAAISTGANLLNKTPYGLNGEGMTVGVWDAARARTNHVELIGKVTVGDSTTANDDHSTHVAGTIAAKGVDPKAKGMGINTLIRTYDWNNDYAEMIAAGAAIAGDSTKIPISNHSYGYNATAADMGRYETECNTVDALALGLAHYLVFWAAGNEQDTLTSLGGYQSITFNGLAKNIMTVGAADDAVTAGVRDVSKGTLAYFSSMGPCDDGRIKPDIVANGVNVYSCVATSTNSYDGTYSGTSMASPNAAGTAALLVQLYKTNFAGQLMRASMLKALMIHTADDMGRPGPDYQYGWGYMNGKAAADVILAHKASLSAPKMIDDSITTANKTRTTSFVWDGSSPIRATLVWTDVEGVAQTATNSRTRNLINDLDLKITAPNGTTTHLPYVMPFVGTWTTASMTSNAVTGTNKVDNVERVDIAAPTQTGTYTVTVGMYGTNSLTGSNQTYSLIVTGGQNIEANPPPVVNITAPVDGTVVLPGTPITITATATDLAVGGQPGQVTKVEFFEDSTRLGEDTSAPYQWNWTSSGSGVRVLTAKATDSENATAVSSPVNVTVLVGDGRPTITSFSPAGGVAGESVVISGNNLGIASTVQFGALAATFTADSPSQVTATVPSSAVTAPITVSNSYGGVTSLSNFNILPIIFREDFSSAATGDSSTTGGSSTAWAGNTNFSSNNLVKIYQAGGAVKLGTSSALGSMTSRAINLAGNGGAFTLIFKVKGWTTIEGQIKVTAGAQSQTVSYAATMSGEFETKSLNFTGGTSATTIKIETTANRAYIDDVTVTSEAPSSPPVITSPSSAGGIAGQAFSYQITASNAPTSFGASNLPAWANINTTNGLITGTPSASTTNLAILSASNSAGVGTNSLTITILPSGGGGGGGSFSGVLLGWNTTGLSTSNTWAPTTNNATIVSSNLTMATQLTRGSSITASGSGVSNAIGGSGGWSTTASDNTAWVFAFQANAGYSVSLTNITGFTRKSGSGPSNVIVDVSVNGGVYTNAGSFSTTSTSGTGSAFSLVLTNITSLQNVPAGQIVKFRINPSGTSGNWYILNGTNALQVSGTLFAPASTPSISAIGSLFAVNTVYGTASTNPTSFTLSGANLAEGITVAPPSGFEVSAGNTNGFAGQGSSILVGSAGTVAATS